MRFSVTMFGMTETYDMSFEELVKAHAETEANLAWNAMSDCNEPQPDRAEFVEMHYKNIVGGYVCEIDLDGTIIDARFPEAVKFLGAVKIKSIIADQYDKVF